jgi:uncharacterized lipoprotein YddW (UPF0748 family)
MAHSHRGHRGDRARRSARAWRCARGVAGRGLGLGLGPGLGLGLGLGLVLAGCDGRVATGPAPVPEDTVAVVPSPPQEGRAVWISRWDWYDRAQLEALLEDAAGANFNMVYLQVSGRSDAYYRSWILPWAHRPPLFNLGQDPGWDPLGVALEKAHGLGLEVHAWLNALIGWCGSEAIPETMPRHVLLEHPDWVMRSQAGSTVAENCIFLTPGAPGLRRRLGAVVADLAREYPVDGIHLDYIRYPNPDFSYDSLSLAGFEAARLSEPGLDFSDFRRRLVTATVREVRDSLRAVDPALPLSAAVWGVHRNTRGWPNVAAGYDTRFQDSWGWAEEGIVDVLAPMIYWSIKPTFGDRLDFAFLAQDFATGVTDRLVFVGMGVEYPPENFCPGCDVVRQIYSARRAGADGVSIFSGRLLRDAGLWGRLRDGPFQERVPTPGGPGISDFIFGENEI